MLRSLEGEVAIVTGASRGIGRAVALRLSQQGADVVVTGRTEHDLKKLAEEIEAKGKKVLVAAGDASKEADVRGTVEKARQKFGKVDILVNNIGIGAYQPLVETSVEQYDEMMAINNRSTFLFTKFVVPLMMEKRYGQIITISSVSGIIGYANEAVYCQTKHAQVGLMEALDRELQPFNIKTCLILPGSVNTYFALGAGRTPGDPALKDMLEADDVADAVNFVAAQPWKSMITQINLRPAAEAKY
jgi:NAD(P)-dependent dehydrogenase (short-subunit alcohol dehydrogenase family)